MTLERTANLSSDGVLLVKLEGQINETFKPDVLDPNGADQLVLDLSGVRQVNSFGVREWIRALRGLNGLSKLYFVDCAPRIIDQFNMVVGFDASGNLLTFRAFYICDSCGNESTLPFDTQLDRKGFEQLDEFPRQCQHCGAPAELDDDPGVLFEYPRTLDFQPPSANVLSIFRSNECWIPFVPGVRLATRHYLVKGHPMIAFSGIIDTSLPINRVLRSLDGHPTYFDMKHVVHVDNVAIEHLRKLLTEAAQKSELTLTRVPPPVLRRAIEHEDLLGGARIRSLALQRRCGSCGFEDSEIVSVSKIDEALRSPATTCPSCGDQSYTFTVERQVIDEFVGVARLAKFSTPQTPAPTDVKRREVRSDASEPTPIPTATGTQSTSDSQR
ncbi:MAG: hypothetical protein AAF658_18135, partial [Myxococcota bacterium]